MQNSLERILVGLAQSLSTEVLPQVDDPYARSQLTSAAELMFALVDRVEWRCIDLHDTSARVDAVLAAASECVEPESEVRARFAALTPVGDKPIDNSTLVARRDESLRCLAAVQRLLAAEPHGPLSTVAARIDDLVGRVQDHEYALTKQTRTRMAGTHTSSPASGPGQTDERPPDR